MANKIPSDTQWQDLVSKIKAKPSVSEVIDLVYPVGSYYETSDASFDPNVAWGGTWVEDTEGQMLVAQDNGTFATLGDTGGAETHQHKYGMKYGEWWGNLCTNPKLINGSESTWLGGSQVSSENWNGSNAQSGGSSKSMTTYSIVANTTNGSNLPPYTVVKRWHRTA